MGEYVTLSSVNRFFLQNTSSKFTCTINRRFQEGTTVSLVGLKTPIPYNIMNSTILVNSVDGTDTIHHLKNGLYPTQTSLNRLIKKEGDSAFSIKIKGGRCHITLKAGINLVALKGSIGQVLGYNDSAVIITKTNLVADNEFGHNSIKTMFLETNFTSSEQVEQSRRPILAVVHSTNNKFENSIPSEYKQLTKLNLDNITFSIKNLVGDYMLFASGKTTIRLHFNV